MNSRLPFFLFSTLLLSLFLMIPEAEAQQKSEVSPLFKNLKFRSVGPAVTGGRIHDVEALPNDASTVYAATASGGLWKTVNKGTTWEPIFDDQAVSTFGDVAISESNPDIVWVGTGEQQNRQSTSWGNGVYRSTDAGASWEHLGLEETRHIGRVRVHPENPDVAYVAALGNLWKGTEQRGVYKTTDGGQSWQKVLYIDNYTGAVDLVMDPEDPNTLYAAAYQRLRRTWGFNGGGPGSGIYKTTDGGENWTELTDGIPSGDKGRIGLAIAETNPDVLYATIEHADSSGTYKTTDAGASWSRVNQLNPRPMYYSHIYVDPTDENRVYILATEFYRSDDGGATFRQMPTRPTYDVGVHSDHHTLWINPNNPSHFYLAGDAGLHESWDMGETYIRINNIPIGQFYGIGVDNRDPYYIYGGMQDNHSWMAPNATRRFMGIINDDWSQIGFGDGMYHQPDPFNYRYVYGGSQNGGMTRLDPETGDLLDIAPQPEDEDEEYRFDWVTPTEESMHIPGTVYYGGNRLFMSSDRGQSWDRTEDLTKNQSRDSLYLMGVKGTEDMLSKHDGTSTYGEMTTISESPLNQDVLWVGTDDGNIQLSRDRGESWTEVSQHIEGINDTTYVSRVEASAAGEGTAYATLDAHRDGDFAPYVYKTTDYGQSWEKITDGLPAMGSVNVIEEYAESPNLLFLGTEHGLFISVDAGESWQPFGSNLPTTLYDDLEIQSRERDLVVGTHGRSIWIFDDLTPLAGWADGSRRMRNSNTLFPIMDAQIMQYWKSTSYRGQNSYFGENPPHGAIITYYLDSDAQSDSIEIQVHNSEGELVRTLKGGGSGGQMHRLTWDMRHEPPPSEEDDDDEEQEGLVMSENILPELPHPIDARGPFVSPGTYTVTVKAGGRDLKQKVNIKPDPKMMLTEAQWKEREEFLLQVGDMQRRIWDAYKEVTEVKKELDEIAGTFGEGELPDEIKTRIDSVAALAERIGTESSWSGLRGDIYGLSGGLIRGGVSQGSLYPPTQTHRDQRDRLYPKLQKAIDDLSREKAYLEELKRKYNQ